MQSFHWNITKFQQQNLIKIYKMPILEPDKFQSNFEREIKRIKRMVDEYNEDYGGQIEWNKEAIKPEEVGK